MGWILGSVLLLFCAGQAWWALKARALAASSIGRTPLRLAVGGLALAAYLYLLANNFDFFGSGPTPTRLTLREALLIAPFRVWMAGSTVAFLLAMSIAAVKRAGRAAGVSIQSPARRRFLEQTATAATAAPFVAGAYGLFYGRLNLETTSPRIRLPRLPKAFEGLRIAQLSDIHIGPFMTGEQIRKYVAIANSLKPDLTVVTGDFVSWDSATLRAVVEALSGLRAPLGVFGCLGNHDAWAGVEDSITLLLDLAGIRILRHASVSIARAGDALNLIGVDFQSRRYPPHRFLNGVEALVAPQQVNILLSHNPDTFDRAAELGIDLSLAGHTHGGQAALEFISPELAPSRLVTPYVWGLFQRPGGQLYVNRGIGTIGVPIRLGARPEITVLELVRS